MKISIRKNVFETNSSSTHSLSVCSKTDFDKWVAGELIADMSPWDLELKEFLTPEEAKREAFSRYQKEYCYSQKKMEKFYQSNKEFFLEENNLFTYESYKTAAYRSLCESETYCYNEKIGEQNIVIFGHYGRDG